MASTITLEIVEGPQKGERYRVRGAGQVLIGRSKRCDVRLPNDPMHWDVSRAHCLIDLRPGDATIRDLGSRNGTCVNGMKIGQRAACLIADHCLEALSGPFRLRDGDRIKVGLTTFRLGLSASLEAQHDVTLRLDADAMAASAT
ncbi:MAG TPA: FHA domain-containing protein [Gemmataceae bacterium]|nr:FHA domain-containing protein [Gemmataceae bacterium]